VSIRVTQLPDAERRPRQVAIGTFDGVHVGHREVIDRSDTVLTFEPHPLQVIHPEAAPKLIMPFEIKRDVIEGLGVEELVVIPFDREFSTIPPEDFCSRILIETLGAKRVSVGENFRFGARATGDPDMLASHSEFETRVVPLVEVDGEIVSSTRIRSLVAAGEVGLATPCLGAPFLLEGTVVEGDGRGRELGFPTANIRLDPACGLRHGIYAVRVGIGGKRHDGVASFGRRPMFDSGAVLLEVFLFDFSGDLYGATLDVAFIGWIRHELAFDTVEELVQRMEADAHRARAMLARMPDAFPPI
jgi:riboflavin kinase/FMN adenylyltransferase